MKSKYGSISITTRLRVQTFTSQAVTVYIAATLQPQQSTHLTTPAEQSLERDRVSDYSTPEDTLETIVITHFTSSLRTTTPSR